MISILSYVQTEVYTINDGTTHIRAQLVADFDSELPAPTGISGFTLEQGSTAIISTTGDRFMLSGGGAWYPQRSASIASLVNDISALQSDMQLAENRLGYLESAAALLIDRGAKNILQMTGTSVTGYGVSCVFDNVNGIITLDGINADKKCTGNFNVQVADPNNLDLVSGRTYHFLCDGTSDTTYGIYIYKSGATPNPQFDCYTNNELPWNPSWSTSNGFRLFIRNGAVVDNVTLKPMITPLEFWKFSENFVPYSPSNAEIIKIIRSYHP